VLSGFATIATHFEFEIHTIVTFWIILRSIAMHEGRSRSSNVIGARLVTRPRPTIENQ